MHMHLYSMYTVKELTFRTYALDNISFCLLSRSFYRKFPKGSQYVLKYLLNK